MVAFLAPVSIYAQSEDWHFNSVDTIYAGIEMHDRESYDSAIAMFDQIHPGDTNYAFAQYEKTLSLMEAERYEEALSNARKGLAMNSRYNIEFTTAIGNSLDEMGKTEAAKAAYDSAIAIYPASTQLLYNRAVMHLGKERYEEGIADLKRAIEISPFHASSHFQLAKLAMNNGNHTQALLSLGYYFISEPASGRTNAILQYFNTSLSEKTEFEPIDYDFDPEKTYAKSDRLIKSYAALRDAYEIDSDCDFPLMKQMHLAISQSVKLKKKTDFWAMYYLPYYKALMEEELFEPFSQLLSVNIETDYYQKIVNGNIDEIKDLINWNAGFLRDYHGLHPKGYIEGAEKLLYYFHNGVDGLSAAGKPDADGNPQGEFEFYYSTGEVSSRGKLNAEGEKIGDFIAYHENGEVSREVSYDKGTLNGLSKEYYESGVPYIFAEFKQGELDGPATMHYTHGTKHRVFNFKNGRPVDTLYVYYKNGQLSAKIPQKEGDGNGLATYYHEDGSLLSKINLVNDTRTGASEFYFPNGQLDVKVVYDEDGRYNGPYESYHTNGQLHEKGEYVEGNKIGNWQSFNAEGKLVREESFDERGKKTGTQTYYDSKGRKTEMFRYKKEEIVYYECYDINAKVQASAEDKRGELDYKEFDLYGSPQTEGIFDETHRIGTWNEYDLYGNLYSKIKYNDEGSYHGDYTNYHTGNASISSVYPYRNDSLHGPYTRYYLNGQISDEGIYYKGNRQGLSTTYHPNGKKMGEIFYVDGHPNGPRFYFDPEGEIERIEYFKMGTIVKMEAYQDGKRVYTADVHKPMDLLILKYPNGFLRFRINRTGSHFQGKAEWFYGNGQLEIDGQYVDGERDGKWTYYYPNGKIQSTGLYHLGTRVDEWKYYWPNGEFQESFTYLSDAIHGPNVEYNDKGIRTDSITYVLGEIDGDRYFYSETGELQHIRVYDLGRIIGWRKLNADGSIGDFVALKQGTGMVKALYPNGKTAMEYEIKKGEFQESPYRTYYSSGQLESEIPHKAGEDHGTTRYYYADGQVQREYQSDMGFKNGSEKRYHPNGKLAYEAQWMAGDKHGKLIEYDEEGNVIAEYLYVANHLYE